MKKTLLEKYGLKKWFDETFDSAEKKILFSAYSDFTDKNANCNSLYAAYFLAASLPWYNKKANCSICMKVVSKITELLNDEDIPVEELHFIYMFLIQTLYKNRDYGNLLELAEEMCNKQIEIAPLAAKSFSESPFFIGMPNHTGFEQLAILEKKNKNWQRVIELCETAKTQGWSGDWDKRITEAKNRLSEKF